MQIELTKEQIKWIAGLLQEDCLYMSEEYDVCMFNQVYPILETAIE